MCRIVGFWDFSEKFNDLLDQNICNMRDTMITGGPDGCGAFTDRESGLSLGHRRLSIIDISNNAAQPMQDVEGRYVICLNGEIYNYKEIKNELLKIGIKFKSNSDTEVVLYAWRQWKEKSINKFRGMFSIAIWDAQIKELTLIRDRVGVKPLYWYWDQETFMFSSELKAFHKHPKFKKEISKEALSLFFDYGYIRAPFSIFKNTYKLEQGTILKLNAKKQIIKNQYWSASKCINNMKPQFSEKEYLTQLENNILESAQLRLVSDVPVGIFLSGGIDSTLITALLQKNQVKKLKTFTIGFEENRFNESQYARRIANFLNTDHYEYIFKSQDMLGLIDQLPIIFDEPFGDSSALPTYMVSQMASNHVKVALSADGGDELFGGYLRYKLLHRFWNIEKVPGLKYCFRQLSRFNFNYLNKIHPIFSQYQHRSIILKNLMEHAGFKQGQIECLGKTSNFNHLIDNNGISSTSDLFNSVNFDQVDAALIWDTIHYLPDDILVKVDRASMANSLEAREPLLDHKLIEWALNLPFEFKYRNGSLKYLLKKLLFSFIPQDLVDRPKAGFSIPLNNWLQSDLNYLTDLISDKEIAKMELLNIKQVQELRDAFKAGENKNILGIWYLIIFSMWYKQWM